MDNVIFWSIAGTLIVSAWLQWYFSVNALMAIVAWSITIAFCILLLRLSSRWNFCLAYISNTWMEFQKIHWANLLETRSLAVVVLLMIAAFSVMLWLMDQLAIGLLTRWI